MFFVGLVRVWSVIICQGSTQINEMTLAFVPKIVAVIVVIIFTMPWMLNMLIDFTASIFNMMPTFIF